jgi:hypothetical protein
LGSKLLCRYSIQILNVSTSDFGGGLEQVAPNPKFFTVFELITRVIGAYKVLVCHHVASDSSRDSSLQSRVVVEPQCAVSAHKPEDQPHHHSEIVIVVHF